MATSCSRPQAKPKNGKIAWPRNDAATQAKGIGAAFAASITMLNDFVQSAKKLSSAAGLEEIPDGNWFIYGAYLLTLVEIKVSTLNTLTLDAL